jgi:hypothetical protein
VLIEDPPQLLVKPAAKRELIRRVNADGVKLQGDRAELVAKLCVRQPRQQLLTLNTRALGICSMSSYSGGGKGSPSSPSACGLLCSLLPIHRATSSMLGTYSQFKLGARREADV